MQIKLLLLVVLLLNHHSKLSHDATHDIDNGLRVQLHKLHAYIQ